MPMISETTGFRASALVLTTFGTALVLIAAQLIFASNNPDAIKAAADAAALGIISP
jgi:hypothetical protein